MNPYFTLLANDIEMNTEFVSAVVITGLVVVFIGLILLILFVSGLGKLFTIKRKKPKPIDIPKKEVKKAAVSSETVSATSAASLPLPAIQDGIDDEIVAVIAAAVAAISSSSGKKLAIKSIRASKHQRTPWAVAGLQENTRPF